MTKLEAVNIMLESMGESKVSSLASGLEDAESAEAILDEVKDDVLSKGWHVNTEENYKLTPDNDGKINVPATALKIDTVRSSAHLNLVVRKDGSFRRLYDKDRQTFVISRPVYVDMVLSYPFEDLPRDYQKYIAVRAAEVLQTRLLGSVTLDAYLLRERDLAWAAMLDAEADAADDNILRDSESVSQAAWRNNPRALR